MKKILLLLLTLMLATPAWAQPPNPPATSVLAGQVPLAVSSTSSRVALPSTAKSAGALTIYNKGTSDAYYALGSSTVVATTSSIQIPAGLAITVWNVNSATYLAAITASSTTNLVIYQGTGPIQARANGGTGGGGGGSPTGPAGGDLSGSYPNPSVATLNNGALSLPAGTDTVAAIAATQTLTNKSIAASEVNSGTLAAGRMPAFTGDATSSAGATALTLATVNSNTGSCGDATHVCQVNLDGKGRATAAAAVAITAGSGNANFPTATGNVVGDVVSMQSTTTGVQDSGVALANLANVSTTHQISSATTVTATQFLNADGFVATAALALTYPATSTLSAANGSNFLNAQGGAITITPNGTDVVVVDGTAGGAGATYVLAQGNSGWLTTNGTGQLQLALSLGSGGGGTTTVASGTAALGTSAISSAACATVVTSTATGVASTDTLLASFNGDPTGTTGYAPATTGMLTIISYPSSGNVNFKVCNNTSASITPGATTLNWRVVR